MKADDELAQDEDSANPVMVEEESIIDMEKIRELDGDEESELGSYEDGIEVVDGEESEEEENQNLS